MRIFLSILFVLFLSAVGVFGDFFIKISGNSGKFVIWKYLILGILIYGLSAFGWFLIMKNSKLSILGAVNSVFTVLFLVLLGVFYFKDSLSVWEIIGLILGFSSLIILGKYL